MHKVILYYKFVPVPDPETVMHWQRTLCKSLGLKGRIIIADHGINGTLGGPVESLTAYIRAMNLHSLFKDTEYKWSMGGDDDFPKLIVKVRDELVTLAPGESFDVFDTGEGLRPDQWHELLTANPEMTVLDARNAYESDVGRFTGASTPNIRTFKEIKQTLAELDKHQPIATYCTGDIRCEYLSAYMKHKGFEQVYHLDGGIVKYGQEFKNDGLWEGKCYVFDRRRHLEFAPGAEDVGVCVYCAARTSNQLDCRVFGCIGQNVICSDCQVADKLDCVGCG